MEGVKTGSLAGAGTGAVAGAKGLVPGSGLRDITKRPGFDKFLADNLDLMNSKTTTAAAKKFQDAINKFKAEDLTKSRSARDTARAAVLRAEGRKGKVVDKLKASIKALDKKSPTYAADKAALDVKLKAQPTAVEKAQKSIDNYKKKIDKLRTGKPKGKGSVLAKNVAIEKVNVKIAEHQAIIDKISGTGGKKGKEGTLKKAIAALEEKKGAHDKSYKKFKGMTAEAQTFKGKHALKRIAKLKKRYGSMGLLKALTKKMGWKAAGKLFAKGALGGILTGSGVGTAAGLAMDAWTIYEVSKVLGSMVPEDFGGKTQNNAPEGTL
jgi:chromosome segregation ATPase